MLMTRRKMAVRAFCDPRQDLQAGATHRGYGGGHVAEEIHGLIRVYRDGHVERFPIVPEVPCTWAPEPDATSGDAVVDRSTRVWARFYVPGRPGRRPLLVYFHGGGFCVGSASWASYHRFLARVASQAGCVVMSVNYRLAPEHRLPAAYDDGVAAVKWVRQQASAGDASSSWWRDRCDFSRVFLGGDSAGGAVAYHAAERLGGLGLGGVVLMQPFFGGEERTASERGLGQSPSSVLSLEASDTYWRLALPPGGARRDHPWCNPLAGGSAGGGAPLLVFVAEKDILRDRDLEFCRAMKRAGRTVEEVLHSGVGHVFQVLDNSPLSQEQTQDMVERIKAFVNR